ncbi:MAG: EamA family transporter [Candidatus Bathyarchaeota archaeon]|jgi:drug/metabolite transporter (DMT)-like permease
MEWFMFALIAPVVFAGVDVIDKYILTNHVANPFSYKLLSVLMEVPILFLLLALTPVSFSSLWSTLSVFVGFIFSLSSILYFKAMGVEEASRVIALYFVSPIFVLPLAFMFLRETLGLPKYLGAGLLVLSAVLVSYRRTKRKTSSMVSPALGFMLILALMGAGGDVLTKHILDSFGYLQFLFWSLIGGLLGGFLIFCFPKVKQNFLHDFRLISKGVFFWMGISTCLAYVGMISYFVAVSLESISLVAAIPSIEPFFVLMLTVLISSLTHGTMKEEVDKRAITLKISAFVLIILGAWLIAG